MTDSAYYFACQRCVERTLEHIGTAHARGRPDIARQLSERLRERVKDLRRAKRLAGISPPNRTLAGVA